MARNVATFVVDVVTKGLKAARDGTQNLGANIRAAASSYNAADKSAGGFYNTQAKGVIGTANSTKSFSKLAETMNSSSGVVGAYATLAANVFAVTAAFNALRGAAQVQQVQAGLEAMGDRMGTTLSVAADNLREISGMTLTAEQAIRSTAQIASAGFGTKTIEDLGKVANDVSVALGRNMTDSMDRLTRGVIKLEPELLDELGLMTKLGESTSRYANQLGKSETQLSSFEKRQGFLNAIVAEGQTKFGGLADEAGNTRNLDLLAATFSDLTKKIFNLINTAALPLAAIFSNKGILLGGMLLFASTISKQLLPGLTNLQIKTAQTAIQLKEMAKQSITAIPTAASEPKSVKSLRSAINRDKAGVEDYQKALDAIEKKDAQLQRQIDNGGTRRRRLNAAQIADLVDQREVLESQHVVIRRTMQLETEATARTQAANAITAAGQKRILVAWHLNVVAVKNYNLALIQANASAGRLGAFTTVLTALRTGFFAAAVGARALGAAMVSALGAIGIAITVIYALYEAGKWLVEWWKGPEAKRYNEALEEQAEILGKLDDRYEEMQRVRKSGIPIAQQEQAIYKVLTNTVRENIEAYEKVKIAQDNLFANRRTVEVGDTAEFETLNKLRNFGGPEIRKQIDMALGREGLTGILEDAGREIDKGKLEKLSNILIKDLRQGAVILGDHINDLAEGFKNLDTAIAGFNRSSIQGTAYDEIVKNFDSVASSLTNISSSAALSDSYINRMANTVLASGDNLQKLFSPDLQATIKEFNELDAIMSEQGHKATAQEKLRRKELQETLALRSSEIYIVQELFLNAQHLSRQTQVQITLEKARLEQLNSYTALTGSSIRQRREAENRILQLQAKQIEAQAEIVKRQIEVTKQQIEMNRILLETDTIYQNIIASIGGVGEATNANFMAEITRRIVALQQERESILGRSDELIDKEISSLVEVQGKYQTINALNAGIRDKTDQITAMEAEKSAILSQQTDAAVINAEANAQNARTLAENTQKELDLTNQRVKNAKILAEISRREQGRSASVAEQYAEIVNEQREISNVQKLQIANASNAEVQEMRVQQARAAGNAAEIAAYDKRISQTIELANARMTEIDRQNRLNILEKFSVDVQKEGLEMQRDSLSNLEKAIDAQTELVNLRREGRNLESEIARRRGGQASNEFTERSERIAEARDALRAAQAQAGLRKTVINLEYALLEAQRQQMIWNLQAQQKILGANSEQGRQLAVVIGNLEAGAEAIVGAQTAATQAVDENIRNLARNLQLAGLTQGKGTTSRLRDFVKSRQDAARGEREGIAAMAEPIADALAVHISPLEASNQALTTATVDGTKATIALTDALKAVRNAPIPEVATGAGDIIAAGRLAQARGLSVKENDAFGWMTPGRRASDRRGHSRNSAHYRNAAIDINAPGGGIEANSSKWGPIFDKLAAEYRAMGFKVLWRTAGHYNHMHVEMTNQVRQSAEKLGVSVAHMVNIPLEAATNTIEAAEAALPQAPAVAPANDNAPITITGKRLPPAVPKDLESIMGYFSETTQQGAFNMLQVFQDMADKLGPQGTIVPTIISGIQAVGDSYVQFQAVLNDPNASFGDKFAAGAAVMQQALGTIQGVLSAAADARVAAIDREIAAEQKRDGKSAESVAKIQAMERRKDAIQRKAFNTNKKLMMAQAIIATAAGVAQALTLGPIVGPIMAAVIGALGAAQLAIIAGTSYQSTNAANFDQKTMPSTLTIGKRGDGVDVARHNPNVGGELGYLRGRQGTGSNSGNYAPIGSAYGGPLPRGYGNSAFVVGEKGPEVIERDTPLTVRPMDEVSDQRPIHAEFHVNAFDGASVEQMLRDRRGDLIDMFREAANANGSTFLEDVNTSHYKKANRGGATRI